MRDAFFSALDVLGVFVVIEEAQVVRLGVGDGAQILHRRVERPMFHPRFSWALFAQSLEKTEGTAPEIFGIRRPRFPQAREELSEGIVQGRRRKFPWF